MLSASEMWFPPKTNATSLSVVPIRLCFRQQSALKPSVPCGKASFEVNRSLLSTSLALISISVPLILEAVGNHIEFDINAWQIFLKPRACIHKASENSADLEAICSFLAAII